jgi:hypothetical protein
MSYPVPPPPAVVPGPPAGYTPVQIQPPTGYPTAPPAPPAPPANPYPLGTPPVAAPVQQPVPSAQLPGWGDMGGGGSYIDFEDGAYHGGLVLIVDKARQQTDFQTKAPLYYNDANGRPDPAKPRPQYPITVQTSERDPQKPEDTGQRQIMIKNYMVKPVITALRSKGLEQPEIGGILYICRTAKGGPGTTNKHHEWSVQYTPATPETVALAQQALRTAPTPAATPPTVAAPAAPTFVDPAVPQLPGQVVPAPAAPAGLPPEFAAAGWTAEQYAAQYGAPTPPAPPAPVAPALPPEYAAAGWTAEQYAAHIGAKPVAPAPPAAPAPGGAPNWQYGAPAATQVPAPALPGVPAPPTFPGQ